jgi:hypothetical protein
MKNLVLLSLFVLLGTSVFSQELNFKVVGQKDTTVYLIRYVGKNLYYADTAEMKNGSVKFDGKKQKPGIMGLLLPEQKFFEFIYNSENISIETNAKNLVENLKIKKSEENKVFLDYVHFLGGNKKKAGELAESRKILEIDSEEYKNLTEEIKAVSADVLAYQKNLIEKNPNKLVSKIVKMSIEIDVPDAPRDENREITFSTMLI